jgi:very-long-chain (3R)-3-hydroxyacyl-CoA dehydratase
MVASWALVEVPRYLFYMVSQLMPSHKVPYPLFWARYNLFMMLYPTGISGEMLQMYISLTDFLVSAPVFYRWTIVLMLIYLPGGPFMIMNMNANRIGAGRRRARASSPPRPVDGLVWPITNEKTGERSSTRTNR